MKKIDLHGMKHELVENALIKEIESIWNTNTELVIVTGKSKSMKDIVKNILDEYKLDYTDGDPHNQGYIKTVV